MKSAIAFILHLTTGKWNEAHDLLLSLQQTTDEDNHTRDAIAKYADWHSRTALHFAIRHPDCMPPVSLIRDLVEIVGTHTACCDADGRTPLAYACRFVSEFSSASGRRLKEEAEQELLDILSILSQQCLVTGRYPALIMDKHDRVPLHVICILSRSAAAAIDDNNYMYNNNVQHNIMELPQEVQQQRAAALCSVYLKRAVQLMLQTPINCRNDTAAHISDYFKRLPLHYAFLNSIPIPIVEMLIRAHPAALYMCDANGNAPMHYLMSANEAYISSVLDVIAALGGGDGSSCDIMSAALLVQNREDGTTPIHMAMSSYLSERLVCRLLQCEPKVANVVCTVYGSLPIHSAIRTSKKSLNDYFNLISELVSCAPSSLMCKDRGGRTPLMLAVQSSARISVETFQVLINGDLGAIHIPCKILGIAPLEQLWSQRPPGMALINSMETIGLCPQFQEFWSKLELFLYASYALYSKYDAALPPVDVRGVKKHIIHAAAIAPTPETLLRSLLRLFPEQVCERNEFDQKLPYQLAVDSGKSPNCVRLILKTFPQAISMEEVHSYTLANVLSILNTDDDGINTVYQIVQINPDICNLAARGANVV